LQLKRETVVLELGESPFPGDWLIEVLTSVTGNVRNPMNLKAQRRKRNAERPRCYMGKA
jgi:hypothetical protein